MIRQLSIFQAVDFIADGFQESCIMAGYHYGGPPLPFFLNDATEQFHAFRVQSVGRLVQKE